MYLAGINIKEAVTQVQVLLRVDDDDDLSCPAAAVRSNYPGDKSSYKLPAGHLTPLWAVAAIWSSSIAQ